jgi:aspartate aminotransferase
MFETLDLAPPDAILGLSEAFQKDSNPHKINLSVGVFIDDSGKTPILECVKEAERRLLETEHQKTYLSIAGMAEFDRYVRQLLLTDQQAQRPAFVVQTPGGTAALRVAADFLRAKFPTSRVWCSQPTWPNHPNVFHSAGLAVERYGYSDAAHENLNLTGMLEALESIPAGDVVCLHACCHNPTGIDPTVEQWKQIAEVLHRRRLLPLVDFAYQGFGDGLHEDAQGLRVLLDTCDELLVCSSFSKNFGLYAERVGALTVVASDADVATRALSHVKASVRANYSNPPKHGAAIVATILANPDLLTMWERELAEMRGRINGMRKQFVRLMRERQVPHDFGFMLNQRGMFSLSGLSPMQVDELRGKHSVYIVGSGRINVAGMTDENLGPLCDAIAAVLGG